MPRASNSEAVIVFCGRCRRVVVFFDTGADFGGGFLAPAAFLVLTDVCGTDMGSAGTVRILFESDFLRAEDNVLTATGASSSSMPNKPDRSVVSNRWRFTFSTFMLVFALRCDRNMLIRCRIIGLTD